MADLSTEDKCKLAAMLLEQAPPGEVNDVINDIRAIINDDATLMQHILPSLREYNLSQLLVVEHPAADGIKEHTSLLSFAGIVPGEEQERFVDHEGTRSFVYDHINAAPSEYEPYELPEEEEAFRAELAKSLAAYTKNHFPQGLSTVSSSQFPLLPPEPPVPEVVPETVADSASKTDDAETAEVAEPPEPTTAEEATSGPVTDVVEEQVGGGEVEPMPTPATEEVQEKQEEVVEPGGLEKVDSAVELAREAEEKEEQAAAKETEEGGVEEEPKVEEVVNAGAEQTSIGQGETQVAPETAPAKPPRKQERVENPVYTLEVVGNRYNVSNFWTGRWRTRWVVDQARGQVDGTINVDVHYYEQGNVQLATQHTATFPCPTQSNGNQSVASQIVTTIAKIETAYHLELNDVYEELGEKAFRALRRALPVTRQKMDWEKVSGYTLGADLTKARS